MAPRSTLICVNNSVQTRYNYLSKVWCTQELCWECTVKMYMNVWMMWNKVLWKKTTKKTWLCKGYITERHGPLARQVKLRVAHVPGMLGTFSPPLWVSDPDMHLGTCVTHVPWCMPGSLISGFLWSQWRGKRSQYYKFYLSDKRPMTEVPAGGKEEELQRTTYWSPRDQ